jgi:hypothetical protein
MFSDDDAIRRIGLAFEDLTLPVKEWTHAAHCTAATYILVERHDLVAERDMPDMIRRYNLAQGGRNTDAEGYHETLTQFYLVAIRKKLAGLDADAALHAKVNAVLSGPIGRSDFPMKYYRRETLWSAEARSAWQPPDLLSLDQLVV